MHLSRQPSRGMTCLLVCEEKIGQRTLEIPSPFGTAISQCHMSFIRQGRTSFPRFMQLFGNRGVTHPAHERRLLCSADQVEEHRASTVPESAAGSLGVVALDCSTRYML